MTKIERNLENIQYYLGIDWGKTFCGVAIADSETKIASAFAEVATEQFFKELEQLKTKFSFSKVIVGKTELPDRQFTANGKAIENFVKKLESAGFKVEIEEEFFSTKVAQSNLAESRKRGISKQDNAESARVILQGWLDRKG